MKEWKAAASYQCRLKRKVVMQNIC